MLLSNSSHNKTNRMTNIEITLGGSPPLTNPSNRLQASGFLSPTIQINRPSSKTILRSKFFFSTNKQH